MPVSEVYNEIKIKTMEYYLCSEAVIDHFPHVEKSKPIKSGYEWDEGKCYVIHTGDYGHIEKYYNEVISPYNEQSNVPIDFWIRPVEPSQVDASSVKMKDCKKMGLFAAIENELSLTKEGNIAYAIYDIARKYNCTPIEFINKIS